MSVDYGAQCATIIGMIKVQLLHADNLDTHNLVCVAINCLFTPNIFCSHAITGALASDDFIQYQNNLIHLSSVQCRGNEQSLLQCDVSYVMPEEVATCNTKTGVVCQGKFKHSNPIYKFQYSSDKYYE